MSIFDKLKRGAADAVKNAAQNAVSSFTEKRETFTFTALPESLAELQALPEADLDTPYKTAALTVCALCAYAAGCIGCGDLCALRYGRVPRHAVQDPEKAGLCVSGHLLSGAAAAWPERVLIFVCISLCI